MNKKVRFVTEPISDPKTKSVRFLINNINRFIRRDKGGKEISIAEWMKWADAQQIDWQDPRTRATLLANAEIKLRNGIWTRVLPWLRELASRFDSDHIPDGELVPYFEYDAPTPAISVVTPISAPVECVE